MNNSSLLKRKSSIELLRIIAMIGIVISHWSVHGLKVLNYAGQDYFNNTIFTSFHMLGKIGVDIFVIISGYFMYKETFELKFKKFLSIVFQVAFYSLLWMSLDLIMLAFGYIDISEIDFIATLFPYFNFGYWFMVAYLALLFLAPFINMLLKTLTRQQHIVLLCGLFSMVLVLSIFDSGRWYNEISLFVFLYCVGGFFKKYGIDQRLSKRNCLVLFLSFLTTSIISIPLMILFKSGQTKFIDQNSFLVFGTALSLFLLFVQMDIKSENISYLINTISKTMFGIYLFHDGCFRNILWRLLGTSNYNIFSNPFELMLNFTISLTMIFGFGIAIELIRINTVEKLTNPLINKIGDIKI